ncbi:15089_t:CDS:2, partial [Gigaspora rosea]
AVISRLASNKEPRNFSFNSLSELGTQFPFDEGHWKVIKRDFLYNFFHPRLDLVVYIIMTKVITHQARKLQQIISGREKPENHQPPFLTERDYNLVETVSVILHNNTEDNVIYSDIEDDSDENSNDLYNKLITLTTKTLNLFEKQKANGNSRWIRNIKKNFTPISKMIEEIEQYKRKRTLPLTWKGHTNNTRFLE